jgi:hypothetical protein
MTKWITIKKCSIEHLWYNDWCGYSGANVWEVTHETPTAYYVHHLHNPNAWVYKKDCQVV